MRAISWKEAKRINIENGMEWNDNQKTFSATNDDESEVYEFDTKRERDEFVNKCNRKKGE